MTSHHLVVFLVDVDNTLIDNDRIAADLKRYLERAVGRECQERSWAIFEERRVELGYADYLGALQRYQIEHPRDRRARADRAPSTARRPRDATTSRD